jgi:hypothetical protein
MQVRIYFFASLVLSLSLGRSVCFLSLSLVFCRLSWVKNASSVARLPLTVQSVSGQCCYTMYLGRQETAESERAPLWRDPRALGEVFNTVACAGYWGTALVLQMPR